MKTFTSNRIFIFFCLLFSSMAFAQSSGSKLIKKSPAYECSDRTRNHFVTLSTTKQNTQKLSLYKNRGLIIDEVVTFDSSRECFVPCESFKGPKNQVEFLVSTFERKTQAILVAPGIVLELVCEKK